MAFFLELRREKRTKSVKERARHAFFLFTFSMKAENEKQSFHHHQGCSGLEAGQELSLSEGESAAQEDLCSASLGEKPRASTRALPPGDDGRLRSAGSLTSLNDSTP